MLDTMITSSEFGKFREVKLRVEPTSNKIHQQYLCRNLKLQRATFGLINFKKYVSGKLFRLVIFKFNLLLIYTY